MVLAAHLRRHLFSANCLRNSAARDGRTRREDSRKRAEEYEICWLGRENREIDSSFGFSIAEEAQRRKRKIEGENERKKKSKNIRIATRLQINQM